VPVQEPPVTELLRAWSAGDDGALDRLIPVVEAELKRLARIYMARERRGRTLQTSALVNEAFLRLVDARNLRWQDRAHFLGISARLMRRVLVDHARARGMRKRGGGAYAVTLDEGMAISAALDVDLVALDRALETLAAVDERKCRVIEMRYFGGLTVEETAEALHVSTDTVKRDWRLAKLWLLRDLEGQAHDGERRRRWSSSHAALAWTRVSRRRRRSAALIGRCWRHPSPRYRLRPHTR
jgi:RNA polymerase sigma factor (TIGR02999 family)